MIRVDLESRLGKQIKILVKSYIRDYQSRVYTGRIVEIMEDTFKFIDKFGETVELRKKDVISIKGGNDERAPGSQ